MSIALRLLITPPICLVMLAACGSSGNSPGDYPLGNDGSVDLTAMPRGEDGATGESAPLPSFAHDILPMLDKSCSCHALAGNPPLLDTYADVADSGAACLQSLEDGLMPPAASLPGSDFALLQSWVAGGMPDN